MSKEDNSKLNIRRSGLKSLNPSAGLSPEELEKTYDSDEVQESDFEIEYRKLLLKNKEVKCAYLIRFKNCPKEFFISFQTPNTRDTGKWEACKYFASINHPVIGEGSYSSARRTRVPQLDKYADTGKVPVAELLKLGASFKCGICGHGLFNYDDLLKNRCMIAEGEGELNKFTKDILVCNDCKRKYLR